MSLSEYALRLARHIAHVSEQGLRDPMAWDEIVAAFDADDRSQLAEAAFELEIDGLLSVARGSNDPHGISHIRPYYELYWTFDGEVLNYPTAQDIAELAQRLLDDETLGSAPKLKDAVGWSLRRFNPAFARIIEEFPDGRISGESQADYPSRFVIVTAEDRVRLRHLLEELSPAEEPDVWESQRPSATAEDETVQARQTSAANKQSFIGLILTHPFWSGISGIAALVALVVALKPTLDVENGGDQTPATQLTQQEPVVPAINDDELLRDNETTELPVVTVAYDPDFLGRVHVPLPNITDARSAGDLLNGAPFHYTHFSIAIDERRRLALYSAANIDRSRLQDIGRAQIGNEWRLDDRVPRGLQRGDDLYVRNDFDRGHLVRYKEVSWGTPSEALAAAQATQTYTNTTPQHKDFNRRAWSFL